MNNNFQLEKKKKNKLAPWAAHLLGLPINSCGKIVTASSAGHTWDTHSHLFVWP
jgi:hypothetical protein